MAVIVDGKVVQNKNAKRVIKPKKVSNDVIGKKIYYIGDSDEQYRLWEGRITGIQGNDYKVLVKSRRIDSDGKEYEKIINKKRIRESKED